MNRLSIIAGGTCGSYPSPHNDRTSRLTTSFGIVRDKLGIVVDNGSGVSNVVRFLEQSEIEALLILQTHLHGDHTSGLPQNTFLFQKKIPVLGIYAPKCCGKDIGDVWNNVFDKVNWPVRPEDFGIEHKFLTLAGGGIVPIPGYDTFLSTCVLAHPGGSLAYRIAHEKGDIVIATDHEPGLDAEIDERYVKFVSGAHTLIADVQYSLREYKGIVGINGGTATSRRGWGHGTPEALFQSLQACEEMPLLLGITHHDPNRTGEGLGQFFLTSAN